MTPLPVIADIARVELHWSNGAGTTSENVFHVEAPGLTEAQISATLDSEWDDSMQTFISSAMSFKEHYITLLDGTSPQQVINCSTRTGGDGGDGVLEAAQVISFRTATRGPRGRGRLYLGPVSEAHMNSGHFSSAPIAGCLAAWIAFANAIEVATDSCRLVVASYTHATAAPVTNIIASDEVALQRRRLLRSR